MKSFQPRDPDWEARCRASFEAQPIVRTLGITLERLEPGLCEMRMAFHPGLTQQHGFFHAGMVTTLADNAGGFAAYTLMPAGSEVLREGEAGDCCYFLREGRAEVIRGAGSDHQVLAELEVGACFGEEALLSDRPRNASVTLLEDGVVMRLDRQDFFALLRAPVVDEVSLGEASRLLAAGGIMAATWAVASSPPRR